MIPPKVLLVDDEAAFVDALDRRLSLRGFETVKALEGAKALELLDTEPNIEVVVLDLRMPGLDGLETLDRIKTTHPLIEVIILTGHGSVASGVDCMKKGAFHFLEKPAEIEELAMMVENAAHRHRSNENTVVSIRSQYTKPDWRTINSLDPFVRRALGYEADAEN